MSYFFPLLKIASIFDIIFKINLHSMSLFDSILQFSIIQFILIIGDESFVYCIFKWLTSKINAIYVFFNNWIGNLNI